MDAHAGAADVPQHLVLKLLADLVTLVDQTISTVSKIALRQALLISSICEAPDPKAYSLVNVLSLHHDPTIRDIKRRLQQLQALVAPPPQPNQSEPTTPGRHPTSRRRHERLPYLQEVLVLSDPSESTDSDSSNSEPLTVHPWYRKQLGALNHDPAVPAHMKPSANSFSLPLSYADEFRDIDYDEPFSTFTAPARNRRTAPAIDAAEERYKRRKVSAHRPTDAAGNRLRKDGGIDRRTAAGRRLQESKVAEGDKKAEGQGQ
ncbi:MAG: hypothetical protein LQ346_007709 [Caloplaca aetnensis]|nr:MAG: hypothetical protein LQ346_007709 [Caloplaca aetnensis]